MYVNPINALRRNRILKILKIIILIVADTLIVNISAIFSLFIRFEFDITALVTSDYITRYFHITVFSTAISLFIFFAMNLYNSLWEYAGMEEGIRIVISALL